MKNHKFACTALICVLDVLARLLNWVDLLNMSEAQAFIVLPKLLYDRA